MKLLKSGKSRFTFARLLSAVTILTVLAAAVAPGVPAIGSHGNNWVLAGESAAASTPILTAEPSVQPLINPSSTRPTYSITVDNITGGAGSALLTYYTNPISVNGTASATNFAGQLLWSFIDAPFTKSSHI